MGKKSISGEKVALLDILLFLIAAERSYGRVMLWAHRRLHMHRERHFQDIHGSKQNRLNSIFVAAHSLGLSPGGLSSGGLSPGELSSGGLGPGGLAQAWSGSPGLLSDDSRESRDGCREVYRYSTPIRSMP